MIKKYTFYFIVSIVLLSASTAMGQQNHMQAIQQRLDSLSESTPGLKQMVQLQVSGTIQQYLAGIASVNNLNISVDPKLAIAINDNLSGVSAENILVFLAKKYSLDISVVGSIIYVTNYQDPSLLVKPPPKEINAKYDASANTLSLALNNDTLTAVSKKISQLSGKNVITTNLNGKLVSAFIESAPFETALDKLAFSNNIKMVKTADGFYLFQPLEDNEELYVNGENNTAVRRTFKPAASTGPAGQASVFSRMVNGQKLVSADGANAPILNLVKQAAQETGKNYTLYSDIKGNIDIHVKDIPFEQFLDILFKGTSYTFQDDNGVYLIGDSKLSGLKAFKAVHLQNRSIDTVVAMIPAEMKRNIEIKEFREQNTLLLSGSASDTRDVANIINQLDQLVPVIMIEVTMIDINKTNTISTGITAGVADSVKTGGTVLPGVNFTFSAAGINSFLNSISKITSVNLGQVVPNFYATIQAIESNANTEVRAVPKLTALNGHSAKISIGNKQYYKNTTQNLYPSSATTTSVLSNVYTPVEADLSVEIKPVVSGDDQVTLSIVVNVASFTSIPTDGSPPPESISQFNSSLRVHSDDTILLGGIEHNENDLTSSGIPILSRIPILKWIFSSRTKTTNKVVTILFIKPTILR
jgi:type IV pilus assembly protein PilQ